MATLLTTCSRVPPALWQRESTLKSHGPLSTARHHCQAEAHTPDFQAFLPTGSCDQLNNAVDTEVECVTSRPRQSRNREVFPTLSPSTQWLDVTSGTCWKLPAQGGTAAWSRATCSPIGLTHTEQLLARLAASYHSALGSDITASERPLPSTLK